MIRPRHLATWEEPMVVGHQNYARERGSRERSHRTRDEHPKMRKLSLVELR